MKHLAKHSPTIGFVAIIFALVVLFASPVYAAGGLNLSTPYPGTTATAGKTATYTLTLDNAGLSPLNANLSLGALPDGWTASFTGGGNEVTRVYVRPEGSATATLSVDIPADTDEGDYDLSVTADAGGGYYSTLDMTIHVTKTDISQGLFTSQFPELQGGASTSFSFNADLTNSSADDRYYSLSAGAPDGWQVSFKPSSASTEIASLTIQAGQSQSMSITVKPPVGIKAGEYTIPCTAVSSEDSMTLNLKVIITGSYSLQLATKDGRLNADAQVGKEMPVTLEVTNNGTSDLTSIALTSTLPTSGWAVRFDQATLDSLAAGATQEVVAYIQPDSNAVTGDYAATITATTTQATTSLDLRVAVKTSTMWGIVAVVIIVLLAIGLYFVFKKFGRR